MAIPIVYNLRSVRARWVSAIVAVLGIAGTVGVFIAMLSLARGFHAPLVSSGSADNALIMRAGSSAELDGAVALDQVKVIQDAPGVAREGGAPLVSPEVVVIANFPLKSTGTDANVQVRGVSADALKVRKNVHISQGRFFEPGLSELVVGRNVARTYSGLNLGDTVSFGSGTWKVVGIFDAGGSAFDSEIWCDARVLAQGVQAPSEHFSIGHRAFDLARGVRRFQRFPHRRPALDRGGNPRTRRLRKTISRPHNFDHRSRYLGGFDHGRRRGFRRAQYNVLRGI